MALNKFNDFSKKTNDFIGNYYSVFFAGVVMAFYFIDYVFFLAMGAASILFYILFILGAGVSKKWMLNLIITIILGGACILMGYNYHNQESVYEVSINQDYNIIESEELYCNKCAVVKVNKHKYCTECGSALEFKKNNLIYVYINDFKYVSDTIVKFDSINPLIFYTSYKTDIFNKKTSFGLHLNISVKSNLMADYVKIINLNK